MNLKNSGVILFMFVMAFIISACSSDGAKVSTSSNSSDGQTTADVPQEIVVRVNDDPDFLDPHKATASISYQMIMNLFEGLMAPETNGSLKEGLAESYEVSEDGLTYTFKIRQGVKFHNGDDLTIEDIQYSFDRLMGKNGGEKNVQ
ncbi:ABC transporter substrate-binding protein [Lysinibacillus sp. MHQ-1]|nr:ABC transporter substrate-binding protein [Lysinibacillus sp. MHQ-1]